MKQFSDSTQKIINAHKNDFDCTNFKAKIKQYGGYTKYVKSLGGVFEKYVNKNTTIKTAEELQQVAEYVFGLMSIYGFDYNNYTKYIKWGGGSPFYVNGKQGKCNKATIDDMCSGKKDCTTNCNYGIDALLYKAGLMGKKDQLTGSAGYTGQVKKYKYQVIRNKNNLKPGDLVHMFSSKITSNDPSTWKGWNHVVCVGEITNKEIILYDAGGRFIKSGNYKYAISKSGENLGGVYSGEKGWVGIRICSLPSFANKEDSDLAIEVLHQQWGRGNERKNLLGDKYESIQKLVNYYVSKSGQEDYIRAAANYILKGFAGNGEIRKKYFGSEYDKIQAKASWAVNTALDVIAGKYGNEEVRKNLLGADYELVQAQVNRILK